MSTPCTCTLNSPPLLSLKKNTTKPIKSSPSPGVFKMIDFNELGQGGTDSCKIKGDGGSALFKSMANGALMGLYPPQPEVDTSDLEKIQEMNAELKESFTGCRFSMMKCNIDQTKDLLTQQIELTKTLQKVTDYAQSASIKKNISMTYFAIGFVVLIFIYIMAIPVYKPPTSDF